MTNEHDFKGVEKNFNQMKEFKLREGARSVLCDIPFDDIETIQTALRIADRLQNEQDFIEQQADTALNDFYRENGVPVGFNAVKFVTRFVFSKLNKECEDDK